MDHITYAGWRRRESAKNHGGVQITTWFLEQTNPAAVIPASPPALPVVIERAELVTPELNRYFYTAVGGDWFWLDRLSWTWHQWRDWLDRPGVETWVASARGTPIGYVELDGHGAGEVELAYFGLVPAFVGRGIGGHLLTVALHRAWTLSQRWPGTEQIRRVWVHTCTLDGPAALANYRARGMRVFRTVTEAVQLPATPPGPWPGADRPRPTGPPR